jgi:hypothetical protein
MTSTYLVGTCTGRSAGFSPLRMRAETNFAAQGFIGGLPPIPEPPSLLRFPGAGLGCLLDEHGLDLPDIVAAQDEARASGNLLKGGAKRDLWNGAAWRLWVTERPNGQGKTFLTLRFSAEM